jgi:hypothetical protein
MAIMEAAFKDGMTVRTVALWLSVFADGGPIEAAVFVAQEDEAVALVRRAVRAGIENDLGSGGNVDLCVITAAGAVVTYGVEHDHEVAPLRARYKRPNARIVPRGSTIVLETTFVPSKCSAQHGDALALGVHEETKEEAL